MRPDCFNSSIAIFIFGSNACVQHVGEFLVTSECSAPKYISIKLLATAGSLSRMTVQYVLVLEPNVARTKIELFKVVVIVVIIAKYSTNRLVFYGLKLLPIGHIIFQTY